MVGVERRLRDLLMEWEIARYRQRRIRDEQSLLRNRDVLGAYRLDFYGPGAPTPVCQSLTAAGL